MRSDVAVPEALSIVVICRARGLFFALSASSVAETMRPLPIAELSGAPAGVLGMTVIRGEAVPVVDAGAALGLPGASSPSRFVTVRAGERLVALAVEEVVSVSPLPTSYTRTLPPLFRGDKALPLAAIGALDSELLGVLDAARVIPQSVFASLERAPSS